MTRRSVRFDRRAREEFDAAADWYEARRTGLGQSFIAAVNDAIDEAARMPKSGGPVPGVNPELAARRVVVRRFPYAVIFVGSDDDVIVVAVAHGRRRPSYWIDRLPG